jgi:PST family polysaccharide transporter
LSELGTGAALIQRRDLTDAHVRVAFSLSVLMGALMTAAVWIAAPAIALMFSAPAVTPVLRLVGLVFVLASFGMPAEALMKRAMDYRRLVKVEVTAYAVGFAAVGVTVAMLGYGVWALVWATVGHAAVKSVMLLVMHPHPLRLCFARAEARQLLDFGVGISLSRLAAFASENGDRFVVGRWLGTTALGYYARAFQLMCLPITQFSAILNEVLFPAYSSIQSDNERLRRGFLVSLSVAALVVFPALTTLAVPAPELLVGVFGPQWEPAAAPFQVLALGGAGYCIYNLSDSLVRAKGAVYAKFFYQGVYAACVFAAASIGQEWGIEGVSVGMVLAIAIAYLLMARLSLKLLGATWSSFFFAQWPGVVASGAVGCAVLPLTAVLRAAELSPLVILVASGTVAIAVALVTTLVLPLRWMLPPVAAAVSAVKSIRPDPRAWIAIVTERVMVRHETARSSTLR